MCYYIGIFVLIVYSFGHVQSLCNKDGSQDVLNAMKHDISRASQVVEYVHLHEDMQSKDIDFGTQLFDCDDAAPLFDEWEKLQGKLLKNIKNACHDFESSYKEIQECRQKLDMFSFDKDQTGYCSTFNYCMELKKSTCAPLREMILLEDIQSNATSKYCTIVCDDVKQLRKTLSNCWGTVQLYANSSSINPFETFSECVITASKLTCRLSKRMLSELFPLFHDKAHDFKEENDQENPERKCIQGWKSLKKLEFLSPDRCRMLEKMKPCITKHLKGNDDRKFKEKLARCQYSVVNLIRTEALHQTTRRPGDLGSPNAAGMIASGKYHLASICWLVTMVTYNFSFQ